MMNNRSSLAPVLRRLPDAFAEISGGPGYGRLKGLVRFYRTGSGTVVYAEVNGLPVGAGACGGSFFGFHIHSSGFCTGGASDPFANAGPHYDPRGCEHPHHAGDLPPLLGNDGYALSVFLTDRFTVREIIDKAVIIHDRPDDFTTRPAGNSGNKIACGVVRKTR